MFGGGARDKLMLTWIAPRLVHVILARGSLFCRPHAILFLSFFLSFYFILFYFIFQYIFFGTVFGWRWRWSGGRGGGGKKSRAY